MKTQKTAQPGKATPSTSELQCALEKKTIHLEAILNLMFAASDNDEVLLQEGTMSGCLWACVDLSSDIKNLAYSLPICMKGGKS